MWPFNSKKDVTQVDVIDFIRIKVTGVPMISARPKPVTEHVKRMIKQMYPDEQNHEVGNVTLHVAVQPNGDEVATWEADAVAYSKHDQIIVGEGVPILAREKK